MDLLTSIKERKSIRAFSKQTVSRKLIEEILSLAGMAPSAINLQPWEFVVAYGEEKDRLVRRLKKAHAERQISCGPGTSKPLPKIFAGRSKEALAVMEPDIARIGMPFNQFIEEGSCSFYGAPIVIFVAMDRVFPAIRYLDVGLAVSYLLLAAHARGLSTCPIGLITAYGDEIAESLNISTEKEILLAVAVGYKDDRSPVNDFKTGRAPLEEIRTWFE
jgi:nitroreductase